MKIPEQLKELLRIPNLQTKEQEMFRDFQKKIDTMQSLSPGQLQFIVRKYNEYKGKRKIVKAPPYFSSAKASDTNWSSISGDGLQKQLDLLTAKDFSHAAQIVAKMNPEERAAWFDLATNISKLTG